MSQATLANPTVGAPAPSKAIRHVPIGIKFAGATGFMILMMMIAVGYSLYSQQSRDLTREVLGRGRASTENLAASASDALLVGEDLTLSLFVNTAIQRGGEVEQESNDLGNVAHWVDGLGAASQKLMKDLPRLVGQVIAQVQGQPAPVNSADKKSIIENEGIYEAVIVYKDGLIKAHSLGSEMAGKAWSEIDAKRRYVKEATEESPYRVYEYETFDSNQKRQVQRLFDIRQDIETTKLDGSVEILGQVHLGMSENLVRNRVFGVTMKLVSIAFAAVLLGLIFTGLVVKFMTAPIGRLQAGVRAIVGGDFDTRVKVASRDELGELTQSFNEMAVSLSQNAMLKGAFTRYVSDAALKMVLADPGGTGIHSRRTLATIFTSDVRGFTSMSETLQPEQVVQVINTYLSLQTEIILKHGGVVDKFIGDATIGVWGKEETRGDDAIRAVRAAVECQASIDALNKEREARGDVAKLIGIGVNTGEIVAGNMGSSKKMEYTCTGEHVIFSDQICAECPGGKVWISESTYALVSDQVIVEKASIAAKGHGGDILVYQVNGFK